MKIFGFRIDREEDEDPHGTDHIQVIDLDPRPENLKAQRDALKRFWSQVDEKEFTIYWLTYGGLAEMD